MDRIEKLKPLSASGKFWIRTKAFLKRNTIAWGAGTVIGVGTGFTAQTIVRDRTGYDPIEHQQLKEEVNKIPKTDYEQFKRDQEQKRKVGLLKWYKDLLLKIKQSVQNPKEFIKSTDTFKQLRLKQLEMLEVIDDAVFYGPALFLSLLLGLYFSNKLKQETEDAVNKEEKRMLLEKLNEVIEVSNRLSEAIEVRGVDQLSPEELAEARQALEAFRVLLPNDDEID